MSHDCFWKETTFVARYSPLQASEVAIGNNIFDLHSFELDPESGLAPTIERVVALSDEQRAALGRQARESFVREREQFLERMSALGAATCGNSSLSSLKLQ